ncbi:unnamed protein product [Anisakis simplex]|uniref:Pectate lyase n=1 Tax=Anisakis simplex TaxID=6269 RepID=A0A0M3JPX9_ANISI|nr:unnamed protein product [Anisakis simplex]
MRYCMNIQCIVYVDADFDGHPDTNIDGGGQMAFDGGRVNINSDTEVCNDDTEVRI